MNPSALPRRRVQRGFSLVELGVVMLVLGLLAVGGMAYWQSAGQQRVAVAERDVMGRAELAVNGFVQARFRLPCPDTNGDGLEDCGASSAINHVGGLPWVTLQLPDASAARLKYGVYRAPSADAWQDTDLAVAIDRMRPLVPLTAPNSVGASELLLGTTNLLDFCAAMTVASSAAPATSALGVRDRGVTPAVRRPMAFVLASPGLLDADSDGNRFDGLNASAANASPLFEAAGRASSGDYDDRVLAISFDTLFARLNCGQALSAVSHSHFNADLAAAVTQLAFVDYHKQLEVEVLLATAGVWSARAGVASAAAGLANAVAALVNATTFTVITYGSTAGLIAAATAAVVVNTAAVVASTLPLNRALSVESEAKAREATGNAAIAPMQALAGAIDVNARNADALGF